VLSGLLLEVVASLKRGKRNAPDVAVNPLRSSRLFIMVIISRLCIRLSKLYFSKPVIEELWQDLIPQP
jgi:hypothetical protein